MCVVCGLDTISRLLGLVSETEINKVRGIKISWVIWVEWISFLICLEWLENNSCCPSTSSTSLRDDQTLVYICNLDSLVVELGKGCTIVEKSMAIRVIYVACNATHILMPSSIESAIEANRRFVLGFDPSEIESTFGKMKLDKGGDWE